MEWISRLSVPKAGARVERTQSGPQELPVQNRDIHIIYLVPGKYYFEVHTEVRFWG